MKKDGRTETQMTASGVAHHGILAWVELALELVQRLVDLGADLGELACLGKYAKMPNAAKQPN